MKLDQIIAGRAALLDQTIDGLRHLVLATPQGPLRLCLDNSPPDAGLNCVIQTDDLIAVRIAALQWLHHSLQDSPSYPGPNCLFPTPFQRSRLKLMLRILDYLADNAGYPNPIREVSQLIVYPRTKFASAAEWKTSSERRRTQRLINEAKSLVNGGYRALLKGECR
ncbi:DUF2285 domain-containing protein [Novosphingobium sp.]|uniref:DUF2285 domain-containing protein n=1 Tax=Novosphingobium sp. TaxID=1874826 RepID=UPI00286DD76E|nr:DUF2285 domain-containing protein [Novosphingobium sp.]